MKDALFCISCKDEDKFAKIINVYTNNERVSIRVSNYADYDASKKATYELGNCSENEIDNSKNFCEFFIRNKAKIDALIQEDIIKQSNELMDKIVQTTTEEGLYLKSLKEFAEDK